MPLEWLALKNAHKPLQKTHPLHAPLEIELNPHLAYLVETIGFLAL